MFSESRPEASSGLPQTRLPYPSSMTAIEEEIKKLLDQPQFDAVKAINGSAVVQEDPTAALTVIQRKIVEAKTELFNRSNAISASSLLENVSQLGRTCEKLEEKLQSNLRMLKLNEGLMSCTNSILEFDTAKNRTDLLVKVLKAKILWAQTCKEIELVEKSDRTEMYQKLVTLQQCNDVLVPYCDDNEGRLLEFEKSKDEFLSWDRSATLFAIKDRDFKKLTELEERYRSLNRSHEFCQTFGYFVRNEFKSFIDKEPQSNSEFSIWSIFDVIFDIWKHAALMEQFLITEEENAFDLVSDNLYEVVLENWDNLVKNGFDFLEAADDPLKAARDTAKERQMIADQIANCSNMHFSELLAILFDKLNKQFAESYGRIVKTSLLRVVNAIEMPAKGSRRKCVWLPTQLEPLQTSMLETVHNASSTFGSEFGHWIIPAYEHVFRELVAKMSNADFFRLKKELVDPATGKSPPKQPPKSLQEETDNQLSFVVGIGTVLQLYDNVNMFLQNSTASDKKSDKAPVDAHLMSNRNLIERLNKRIVMAKANNIAEIIVDQMAEGMDEMKNTNNPVHSNAANLPSFSRAPHNYILGVGHGLLSQMNVISSFTNEAPFNTSIVAAAGGKLPEDETDVWLLNAIAELVMRAFCHAIGDLTKLPDHVQKQLQADIVYFIDASKDLRLQPIPQLTRLHDQLCN